MLTLIQGANVYAPTYLGTQDVLIGGGKIIAIDENIILDSSVLVKRIDGKNKLVTPGFVDSLVHITGGGGEAGFASRTPEMNLTDAAYRALPQWWAHWVPTQAHVRLPIWLPKQKA